jgi:hypothetical protein
MAAMQQFGLSQIPEEGIGAATGVLGSFAPEFTLAGDAADLGRAYGHLTNREDGRWAPEWGGAALSSLAAVPFVGTPIAGLLKARRGVSAATETARAAQEAARAAQEERRIERVAARYSPERPTIGPEVVRDPEIRGLLEVTEAATVDEGVVFREAGSDIGAEGMEGLNRSGRAYRGMEAAEYDATVGSGGGAISRQDYSVADEGTSYADDIRDAESYVNFGRSDPRITGRPSYIVEVDATGLTRSPDGYLKASGEVPPERIERVWKITDEDGALVGREVAKAADELPVDQSATGGLLEVTEAASLSARARELDPTPSTVREPRIREGLEGVRTAGTPGRGIASVRELDLTEAVRQASRGAHLVRGTGGQYVGAPRGMDSPGALRALRRRLDKLAVEGEVGRDWYDRSEAGNLEIAGPHADRTGLLAAEQGLWSAGATPEVNLGFAISGHNPYEAGAPVQVGRWPSTQGQRYIDARDAGGVPGGGPKTGIYGGHLDPFVESPITGTNDIWHARAFGYTNADGSEFSRGLSPQEHAFMDAETLLSAERMNASRGTDVWDGRGSQAAIWVRMKGAALAEEKGLTLAEGIAEAMKSYPDYFDKQTLSATYEAFPGVGTGHLPGLQDMTWAERQAYTDEVPWTTQAGNDVFADALGMYSQRTTPGTGYFEGLINPNRTARPLVARSADAGVDPRDAAILAATQATRGLLDAQNASAWHHVRPDAKAGQQTSAVIGLDRAATPDEMRALENLSEQHIAIDTGTGVTLMADPDVAVSSRDVLKRMEGEWKPAISDAGEVRDPQGLPYGPPRETHIPGATSLDRVAVDSNYQSLLELKNAVPGGGVVTDELLRLVDEADALAPTTSSRLSAPTIRHRAGLLAERDDLLADIYGGVREDLQNFRRIFAEKGLAGIRAAREAGVALPAWVLAFLGANELRGEREGG